MKNTRIKQMSLILLALLMLLTSMISCSTDKSSDDGDSDSVSETESTDIDEVVYEYDENGYVKDRLPETLDYKYQNVNMLHWTTSGEYAAQSVAGDALSNALYYRITNVQDRLKCFLTIKYAAGDWNNRTEFINKVYNDAVSGDPSNSIVAQYSFAAPIGAMYGLYANLADAEYIDLSMPWWSQDMQESVEINGKQYFATGDIAPNATTQIFCMFYNADLLKAEQVDIAAFQQDVIDGKWTYEMMYNMIKDAYLDSNNTKLADEGDFFGLNITDLPHYDAIFYAAGMKIINKNADGSHSLSPEFVGTRTDSLVDSYLDILKSDDCMTSDGGKSFLTKNSLFVLTEFGFAPRKLKDVDFTYGVLPVPKYDDTQLKYSTCLAAPYSLYSVMAGAKNKEMAGAVMEALASDAYRNITPVLYEEGLKLSYSKDANDAIIYDMIHESLVFDIGRIWGDQIKTDTGTTAFSLFRNTLRDGKKWMGQVQSVKGAYIECLDKVVQTLNKLDQ